MTDISLHPATPSDRLTLENLVQLYAYDWSEILPSGVGPDGKFSVMDLGAYWTDPFRHPFLLRVGTELAGFALILSRSRLSNADGIYDMNEFFVMRSHRRKRVGRAAAFAAFERFKGPWEVRQRDENTAATEFWRRTIGEYTQGRYEEVRWDGLEWKGPVQRFTR
jgi:predicted acetyltransferase